MSLKTKRLRILLGATLLLFSSLFFAEFAQASGISGFIGVNVAPVYDTYSYRQVVPVVPVRAAPGVVVRGGAAWGVPYYGVRARRVYPVTGAASIRINRALSKWNPAYYGHLY